MPDIELKPGERLHYVLKNGERVPFKTRRVSREERKRREDEALKAEFQRLNAEGDE